MCGATHSKQAAKKRAANRIQVLPASGTFRPRLKGTYTTENGLQEQNQTHRIFAPCCYMDGREQRKHARESIICVHYDMYADREK